VTLSDLEKRVITAAWGLVLGSRSPRDREVRWLILVDAVMALRAELTK